MEATGTSRMGWKINHFHQSCSQQKFLPSTFQIQVWVKTLADCEVIAFVVQPKNLTFVHFLILRENEHKIRFPRAETIRNVNRTAVNKLCLALFNVVKFYITTWEARYQQHFFTFDSSRRDVDLCWMLTQTVKGTLLLPLPVGATARIKCGLNY